MLILFLMKIKDDYLLVYARKDSQRLRDTFFYDTNKEKIKKDNIVLFVLIGLVLLCTIAGIVLARYDVLMVKRVPLDIPKDSTAIMSVKNTYMELITKDNLELKGKTLYGALAPKTKAVLKLSFSQPLDMRNKSFILYTRSQEPITVEAVLKDSRFFSNAGEPLTSMIEKSTNDSYVPTTFDLTKYSDNRINLNDIQQVTLYFYPKNEGTRVTIKDIVLTGKN
jgi:hypothetical protein